MPMKRILIALSLLLWLGGCSSEGDSIPETPATVKSLEVDASSVTLARGATAQLKLRVTDPDAVFNFALSSERCQVQLRLHDDRNSRPSEVALQRIVQGEQLGEYLITLADLGGEASYRCSICVVIRLESGALIFSNPIEVQREGYVGGLTGFRFMMSMNPTLEENIELDYDPQTNCFSGRIPSLLTSMELVATFDTDQVDRVEVNGVEQQSGKSRVDFSREVIYTVYSNGQPREYKVRVKHFTGLPIVWIETPGKRPVNSKDVWIEGATIRIDGAGDYDDLESRYLSIRGRGNSTWGYEKKPYALKFDEKAEVLGMPKHKRWCLLANYMDRTLLRNRIAYFLAEQTSLAWTPKTRLVELFLNGKHLGNYLLTEQVRVDNDRIDITEMTPEDNSGEAVTGGYLLELDFHFDNRWQWHTAHNVPFAVKYPDEEDLTSEQFAWIQQYIASVESCLYGSEFKDTERGFRQYIDPQSFVDYWLIYELCVNHELANPGSVYLYKDRGGKLFAGPVWDFDWGTFSYNASSQAKYGLFMTHAWWYGHLFDDEGFRALAKERWQLLRPNFEQALEKIDREKELLIPSEALNDALWNISTTINGDENLSFSAAVARMRTILEERIEIIDREVAEW